MDTPAQFVTVIMPVYNEERYIRASLGAVLAQDYPPDRMEVLVVDGRSADRTREIVAEIGQGDARVRLLDNPDRDQASALNTGIRSARGQVIVRVDGHGRIPPHYVAACVRVLAETDAWNAGGQMRAMGATLLTRAVAAATSSPFATGGSRFHYSRRPGDADTVYLGAFRREVFDRVGLFDPAAVPNEDYEMNYRIRAAGGRVYYSPDIWAEYHVRPSLRALARQYFRYGWRKASIIRRHPGSARLRHLVPPLALAAALAVAAAAVIARPARWALAALVGAYALADLAASAAAAARSGWQVLGPAIFIFPVIHLSWGSGFVAGAAQQLVGSKKRVARHG
jgi:glycosyltransferase involved in cell wall biosynthesis